MLFLGERERPLRHQEAQGASWGDLIPSSTKNLGGFQSSASGQISQMISVPKHSPGNGYEQISHEKQVLLQGQNESIPTCSSPQPSEIYSCWPQASPSHRSHPGVCPRPDISSKYTGCFPAVLTVLPPLPHSQYAPWGCSAVAWTWCWETGSRQPCLSRDFGPDNGPPEVSANLSHPLIL